MRIAKLVQAAVAIAAAVACSDPTSRSITGPLAHSPDGPQLITGGQPTSAYGGVGAVFIDVGGDGVRDSFCTGSLISPTVLLTAGHCIRETGTVYHVSFVQDVIPVPPPSDLISSTTAFASTTEDIGVIILPEGSTAGIPVYDLPPLGLLTELAAEGGLARDAAIVVGYGVSSLGGMETSTLDGVRKVATTRILLLTIGQIVVAGANGNSALESICFGDSGGPLFLESDPETIVGVAWLVRLAGCQGRAAHTRIDTPDALAFLAQYVAP